MYLDSDITEVRYNLAISRAKWTTRRWMRHRAFRMIDMLPSQEVMKHNMLFRLGFLMMRLGALCSRFSCLDRLNVTEAGLERRCSSNDPDVCAFMINLPYCNVSDCSLTPIHYLDAWDAPFLSFTPLHHLSFRSFLFFRYSLHELALPFTSNHPAGCSFEFNYYHLSYTDVGLPLF